MTSSQRPGGSRRQFLAGTGGLAASLLAVNEVFGRQFFEMDPVETFEPAARGERRPPDGRPVGDDRTHIIRSSMNGGGGGGGGGGGSGGADGGSERRPGPQSGGAGTGAGINRSRLHQESLRPHRRKSRRRE